MRSFTTSLALSYALAAIVIAGCSDDTSTNPESSKTEGAQSGHVHPTEGPHHGDLIELGNEEYHAEILHDEEAGTVAIYILDSAATEQIPIDASEVTINVKHDGQPEQFTLAASPDSGDADGKSSRFVSSDEELLHHLDEEGAEPRLVVTISGKSYRGVIAHDHDGEDHDD